MTAFTSNAHKKDIEKNTWSGPVMGTEFKIQ